MVSRVANTQAWPYCERVSNDQNRFKKLELKKGRPLTPEEISVEKSQKFKLQQLERKQTIDKTIDQVLSEAERQTNKLGDTLKTFALLGGLIALVFLLASHQLFGADRFLALILKILIFAVLPILVFRWVLKKE